MPQPVCGARSWLRPTRWCAPATPCSSLAAFHVAPRFDEPETISPFTSDTATTVFNVTGHPAMSICTGYDSGGVPLNAQIVGRFFDEATVLQVAQAYESATPWRDRRPAL